MFKMLKLTSCVALMVLCLCIGLSVSASEVQYTQLRLSSTQTTYGAYSPVTNTTLVVEGKRADNSTWETISNSDPDLHFKSMFPVVSVSQVGVVTINTAGSGQVLVTYANPDNTFVTKGISIMGLHYTTSKHLFNSFESEAQATSTVVRTGAKSIASNTLASDLSLYVNPGTTNPASQVSEFWFYDNLTTTRGGIVASNDPGELSVGGIKWRCEVGVNTTISQDYYYIKDSKNTDPSYVSGVASQIKRTEGWHQVVVDCTRYEKVSVIIDGVVIYQNNIGSAIPDFNNALFRALKTTGSDVMYYDDFNAYYAADGRPVLYNVLTSSPCNTSVGGITPKTAVTYEFFAPLRPESKNGASTTVDSTYSVRNTTWSTNKTWSAIPTTGAIEWSQNYDAANPNNNHFWFRLIGRSTASSTDYNASPQYETNPNTSTSAGAIQVVSKFAGRTADVVFLGNTGGKFRNISADGLAGEKKVRVLRRVSNNAETAYNEVVIGALYVNGELKSVDVQNLSAASMEYKELAFDFDITDDKNSVIKIFKWNNLNDITPIYTSDSFDCIGIK